MDIMLASSSPRRIALLRKLKIKFKVKSSNFNESHNLKVSPIKLVIYNSLKKAQSAKRQLKNPALIIGADTIVVLGKEILGKPLTNKKAAEMLRKISGKYVRVITGITILNTKTNKIYKDYEITYLKIKNLSEDFIQQYVESGEPLDKAGAFGIQGKGSYIIQQIRGDYHNVIGLPLKKLKKLINKAKRDST